MNKKHRKHRKHKRKDRVPMNKGTKTLLIIVSVIVGIALVLGAAVLILNALGRSQLTDDGLGMNAIDGAELLDEGRVRYKGQLYQYKKDITTILLMGVDQPEKGMEAAEYEEGVQADMDVLLVLDPMEKKITMISLSRDTMCQIDIVDASGNVTGTAKAQLALSYAYGDGADLSCQLTKNAVSRVFYGLPISAYGSIYMDGIAELVDEVGGVTVTALETFDQFTEGQTVTLTRDNTNLYVRYRDHSTAEGNNQRMERQKQVLLGMARGLLSKVRQSPASILDVYRAVQRNVTTDLNTASMVYLARTAAGMSLNNDVIKVQGEAVLGADGEHAEFTVDETALYELILSVFYEPIDG